MKTNKIKRKHRGFTLIELLVTIFCGTIVIGTVSASVYFVSKTSNEVIKDSNHNIELDSIRDFIIKNKIKPEEVNFNASDTSLKIYRDENVKFELKKTNLVSVVINKTGKKVEEVKEEYLCTLTYKGSYGLDELSFKYCSK